jgi:hypothetical protein
MDNRDEIRDFLTSRRARITPQQAGLPDYGGSRRVTGLRREEVAPLRAAGDTVAILRAEAGRNPHDRALSGLIGELSTRSDAFRRLWAAHNVRFHRTGRKRFCHPVVGDLDLAFEALDLTADGLRITAYTAEPSTPSHDALNLLASWAATIDQAKISELG